MKRKKMLGISLLALVLGLFLIPLCNANTIEKDYGEFVKWHLFTFNVKVIIETEGDGTWRNNTEYRIYIRISMTGIDSGVPYPELFDIYFNRTGLHDALILTELEIVSEPYLNWAMLNWEGHRTETLLFAVRSPNYTVPSKLELEPYFWYYYDDPYTTQRGDFVQAYWMNKERIVVDTAPPPETAIAHVKSLENQLNTMTNLVYVLIAITAIFLVAVLAAVVATIYFARRKPKAQ